MDARTETLASYQVQPAINLQSDDAIIAQAVEILRRRVFAYIDHDLLDSPSAVRTYLTLRYAQLDHEEFGVIWVDARNRVISMETLFRGTLSSTAVYPREVVKAGLAANASAAIFFHNHPSCADEPSRADELLTSGLKAALALVDIRALDHLIVAGVAITSFAERGLL